MNKIDFNFLSTSIAARVKKVLTFQIKGYESFTPENLAEIEDCVRMMMISSCGVYMRIHETCALLEDPARFVRLVGGDRIEDKATSQVHFTGLSELIYKKSSVNFLPFGSYYHFSANEYRSMSCRELFEQILDKETKKR
jgi:hypothetical protein